jgi:hypothetical protein
MTPCCSIARSAYPIASITLVGMFGLLVVLRNEPYWGWPTADGDCNVLPDFDALTGDGESSAIH